VPRKVRDSNLETRTARARLRVAHKPYFRLIRPGLHLGYRKLASGPGTWIVRRYTGEGSYAVENIRTTDGRFIIADDYAEADGQTVLSFGQAQEVAQKTARAQAATVGDVAAALDAYERNLRVRGGDTGNVSRARLHVPDALGRRPIALLTVEELQRWRDGLADDMAKASANRVATVMRAALNFMTQGDDKAPRGVWKLGLAALPGAERADNVVLSDVQVRRVVREAYKVGEAFGLFVEVAAISGARPSQICRIECRDAQRDHLMVPASKKGKGEKAVTHRRVPIDVGLARRLQTLARGRPERKPLLRKPSGEPWRKSDHTRPFRRVAENAGLDTTVATIYALRHSSITRQLRAGVPVRVVAALHDTSVAMIEKSYSVGIDAHVDAIVRPALIKV
jgi:integrase